MAKAPTLSTDHADEWAPPAVNAQGYEVDEHGLPTSRVARAIQLAEQGAKSDPADPPLVTREEIAAQNPKGVQADQDAAAQLRVERDWGEGAKVSDIATAVVATSELPVDNAPAAPAADSKEG